jgi:hypothetical protein
VEEVLQHTLRICRCDAAALAHAAERAAPCSSRSFRTLAMRVAQLESESRREKEVRERSSAVQPSLQSQACDVEPTFGSIAVPSCLTAAPGTSCRPR